MEENRKNLIKISFGARLRAYRKKEGLSQDKLALNCNLDRTYIGAVERGERNISIVNIYKIADALEISPRELLE